MYYPSSENKGADQLRGYREADLRLCFRICRLLVFPWGGSNYTCIIIVMMKNAFVVLKNWWLPKEDGFKEIYNNYIHCIIFFPLQKTNMYII